MVYYASPKLPLEPLLRASGATASRNSRNGVQDPITSLARFLGVQRRVVHKWALEGIPLHNADRYAAHLGMHPTEVWGETFYVGCD